jgi:hypothetical protein
MDNTKETEMTKIEAVLARARADKEAYRLNHRRHERYAVNGCEKCATAR